jgi:glucose-1-phosphate thymidylyltransferase
MIKGVILAGGAGTRLHPITKVTSKQLLPLYNKPMIYFPIQTLLDAGVRDILIIVSPEHSGDFINLLGSGKEFGDDVRFSYEVQDAPLGLAHGLGLARNFAKGHKCSLILGDNLFTDSFKDIYDEFNTSGSGAVIFAKEVKDPRRFGVIEFDDQMNAISIEEKPEHPKSNYAQTGLYIYDEHVFDYIDQLTPSPRGELEITDLHKIYLEKGQLQARLTDGVWQDTGTFKSMFRAAEIVRDLEQS